MLDPADNWAVVDTTNDVPAEYAGRVLIGLTVQEVRWFTVAANEEIGRRGAKAPRLRQGSCSEHRQPGKNAGEQSDWDGALPH